MPTFAWVGKVSEPLFNSPRHAHSFWEVGLYTAGEGVAVIGSQRVPFKPGTIICYPPVIAHQEHSAGGFTGYFLGMGECVPHWTGIPVFTDSPDGAFALIINQLFHEWHLSDRGWEQITQHLFQLLVAYIDRWQGTDHHPLVVQLKGLIVEGMSNPKFNLVEAMESLPLSVDHLRRLFVRSTGVAPSAYLTSLRVEEAKRLLQVLRLGVKETSWQVGFRDPGYFSRVFRKHTGQWPSEFAETRKPGQE
jgi:AraC-like DNA-binding protein